MAIPKVFISSTCYDLLQIRDSLFDFITDQYLEPILSEKGDVFYHPDLHTHESCIDEVGNCQLFILIIGGRFGGKYKYDPKISITNAEYDAAVSKNIPVYTFIKREVYEDHRLYQSNKHDDKLIKKITFPAIEKQDYALNIFEFINRVRRSDVNNGFFTFELVKEIKDNLGKQWSGLLYQSLMERQSKKQEKLYQKTLDNLTLLNRKTEEIVKNLYKEIKPNKATTDIASIEKVNLLSKFFLSVLNLFEIDEFQTSLDKISKIDPTKFQWFEYLAELDDFSLIREEDTHWYGRDNNESTPEEIKNTSLWLRSTIKAHYWPAIKEGLVSSEIINIESLYENFVDSTEQERRRALEITNANNR